MKQKLLTIFAVTLLLGVFATANAQTVQISGKVTLKQADGTEVPASNALVTVFRTDVPRRLNARTDNNGNYTLKSLAAGNYSIVVKKANATASKTGVRITKSVVFNFVLENRK